MDQKINQVKEWKHIVNGNIEAISQIHPLENQPDKKIFLEYLLKDLNIEKYGILSKKNKDNLFELFFDKNYYNVFLDHVDQGGRKGKTDTRKKVSIDYNNSAIKELLLDYKKLLVINYYCPLIEKNGNYEVDWENRIYIIIRPDAIYRSKVYLNLMNNIKPTNPSSRWVDLTDILKVKNYSNLDKKTFDSQDIFFKTSSKTRDGSTNIYLVDKNNIFNFMKYIIRKEYSNTLEEILAEYSKKMLEDQNDDINDEKLDKHRKQFRELLISERGLKCEIIDCDLKLREMLVASHIKPVNIIKKDKKLSQEEKGAQIIDCNNGFLLCSNHDKLFDRFIMSFDINGNLIMNENIDEKINSLKINRTQKMLEIKNPELVKKYLKYHNDMNEQNYG